MVDTSTVHDDPDRMSVEAVHQLVADMGTGGVLVAGCIYCLLLMCLVIRVTI